MKLDSEILGVLIAWAIIVLSVIFLLAQVVRVIL